MKVRKLAGAENSAGSFSQAMRTSLVIPILLFASTVRAQIEKLPLTVNHPVQSELLPVISADGKTLYFTRTRMGLDSSMVFDVWTSHLTDTGFSKAEFLGGNLASS